MNGWIFDYVKTEDEGIRFIKEQLNYLVINRYWQWIPYTFILSFSKYMGLRLGLFQNRLPTGFKKLLSLNQNFWNQKE
jgi:rhamnosyltransferase